MPTRILRESICTSDTVDKLKWFEEVFYYRLIVNCDDYGRFDARAPVLKSRLFPLKDNITLKNVQDALDKLATVGLVTLYTYDSRPYLQLPTWAKFQNIRTKKSKYPEPENNLHSSENICMQMNADASKCSRNPIRIQSESESNPPKAPQGADADGFGQFWAAYPRKTGKSVCRNWWQKHQPGSDTLAAMLQSIDYLRGCEQWQRDGGKYIPMPSTWLNQRRWEDEDATPPPQPKARKPIFDHELTLEQRLAGETNRVVGWQEVEE